VITLHGYKIHFFSAPRIDDTPSELATANRNREPPAALWLRSPTKMNANNAACAESESLDEIAGDIRRSVHHTLK